MARRRMISAELISDEDFNSLSIEGQLLFIRMLSVSDDCGVVPASDYTLKCLTNPPEKIKNSIEKYVQEIVSSGLGRIVLYNGKQYFLFKKQSFERIQSYIINKRISSEYLKITAKEFDSIDFDSIDNQLTVNSISNAIESSKQKVESSKQKEESESKEEKEVYGEFKNVFLFKGEYEKLILKEGKDRTDEAIEVLGSYMESRGKKYKSHYAALISWCFKSIDETKIRGKPKFRDERSVMEATLAETIRRYGGKE